AHPVPALARAVADAVDRPCAPLLERRHRTALLRDTAPEDRVALVAAAGYRVTGSVDGASVVLVDDVVLTGTTLEHLASLLVAAGARGVDAVVACRTRRRSPDLTPLDQPLDPA
ncbi:MAG: phosphoribosyltransferase family protein, partial [Acidimicrobiales bacterium]